VLQRVVAEIHGDDRRQTERDRDWIKVIWHLPFVAAQLNRAAPAGQSQNKKATEKIPWL
jgi:hypothetical protein